MPFRLPARSMSASAASGGFDHNYKRLKRLINTALKEGTPLRELHLIPKNSSGLGQKPLSRSDLLRLLGVVRRIRVRYQEILQPPVPPELVRDILAKAPEQRLPWEDEALGKAERWSDDVKAIRVQVLKELDDYLGSEFFRAE